MQPLVDFILDGRLFAAKMWTAIPRVGEVVLLKDGKVWAEVTQVVWGDDSSAKASGIDRQWIQVLCKTMELQGMPNVQIEAGA